MYDKSACQWCMLKYISIIWDYILITFFWWYAAIIESRKWPQRYFPKWHLFGKLLHKYTIITFVDILVFSKYKEAVVINPVCVSNSVILKSNANVRCECVRPLFEEEFGGNAGVQNIPCLPPKKNQRCKTI